MKKLRLYLETSVFGFYFDTSLPNKQKRTAVRKLLQQIKDGVFEGYVSGLVRRISGDSIQQLGDVEFMASRIFSRSGTSKCASDEWEDCQRSAIDS